jgi:UDP-N-acetylmuramoyl-tripeptide--D-alanyl-D-alanine ligase
VVFYNFDNDILKEQAKRIRNRVSYGVNGQADIRFTLLPGGPLLHFVWHAPDGEREVNTQMYGRYNLENVMAAIAVGVGFGVPPEQIVSAVEGYVPGNMRSQVVLTDKGNRVILDAYNANPTSMQHAIEEFSALEDKSKAVILGDMFELGAYAKEEHQKILDLLREKGITTEVFLVGKHFSELAGGYGYLGFPDRKAVKEYLKKRGFEDFVILVKGSRMMQLEDLLSEL